VTKSQVQVNTSWFWLQSKWPVICVRCEWI